MDIYTLYTEFQQSDGISIDTRTLKENQIFFAFHGEKVDGNSLALKAIESGARLAIVSNEELPVQHSKCIYFENTLFALQQLAIHHRKTLQIPIIGITGSVAKTTTKDLIACVLAKGYKTFATTGNLNNQIGVPLTILSIGPEIEIAVIEMGANHIGEIGELCNIAMPSHGLITRIGHAHLEGFGSLEGIIVAKSDLYRYIRDHHGTAFINDHDPILKSLAKGFNMDKIFIHEHLKSKVSKADPELEIELEYKDHIANLKTHIPGLYNLENIEASILIGMFFNIQWEEIMTAISTYKPKANRSEWITLGTNEILLDAYNANPTSMKEAIRSFAEYKTSKKKIIVLGEMKEMGEDRIWAHTEVMNAIKQYKLHGLKICLVGPSFIELNVGEDFEVFENVHQAKVWYDNSKFEQSVILIKGSRSMTMEKILGTIKPGSEHG